MSLTDTHCHLNDRQFAGDREETIERALQAGVETMLVIGCEEPSWQPTLEMVERFPSLACSLGMHPYEAEAVTDPLLARLRDLAAHPRVVAIGESGLDFYRAEASPAAQERAFRGQIEVALSVGLPVIVHTRASTNAALDVLEDYRGRLAAVLHCWSGTPEEARRAVEAGWYLGIGGVVTFKNAPDLHAAAAELPLDRLLLETDAPYLAPHPHRGQRNEPAYIPVIAQRMAELRGCGVEEIAETTSANARRLFGKTAAQR